MKRKILQTGSLLMAFYMLFVVLGLNVHFHFCDEDHRVMTSFGDASMLCEHCMGHHHDHVQDHKSDDYFGEKCFNARCCCEDFGSDIVLSDAFTFSMDKNMTVFLPVTVLTTMFHLVMQEDLTSIFLVYAHEKIPYQLTGHLKTIFFSNLKLNPLV